jgi:hypothetical protein
VIDAGRLVKGLSFRRELLDIGLTNVITSFTAPATFFTYFPTRVIRNSAGAIQVFDARTINAAGYQWKGSTSARTTSCGGPRSATCGFSGQIATPTGSRSMPAAARVTLTVRTEY